MSKTPPPKDKEANRLTGRVARYAKVSTSVGGLAMRIAGQKYLGFKKDRPREAGELRAALGGLKGPLMKVAQMLATIPDAVPEEYAQELMHLQSDAPPMGWPFVKRRMSAELGADWQKRFKSFSQTPMAAASLGQVHRAETLAGEDIVCKLQYPDMASAVEADLGQLRLILGLFERMDPAFKTSQVHEEIADRLREELDYKREAMGLQMFSNMLQNEPHVRVPKFYPDLSTGRLLTMSTLHGTPLPQMIAQGLSGKAASTIAAHLFRTWYVPLYHYGIIHGDPHPGNYRINERDHSVSLLDFGCLRVFKPHFVKGVSELYHGLQDEDNDRIVSAFEHWGFKNLRREVIDILLIWARFIYGPVLEDRVRLIDETESGLYGRSTARKVHFALRDVGGVEVPREFVFMDRAAVGLGSMFLRKKAKVNWHNIFNELIEDFDVKEVEARQKKLLSEYPLR